MAADLTGNPLRMDTNNDTISGVWVQQILWVATEDAAFEVQDQLTLTINGTTCNYRNDLADATGRQAVALSIGPFAHPVWVDTFTVTLIEGGAVEVWLALHPPRQSAP